MIINVTAVESYDRSESGLFCVILNVFWPIQVIFAVGEPSCDLEIPSWVSNTLLMIIYTIEIEWLTINVITVESPGHKCIVLGDYEQFLVNSGCFCGRGATLRS